MGLTDRWPKIAYVMKNRLVLELGVIFFDLGEKTRLLVGPPHQLLLRLYSSVVDLLGYQLFKHLLIPLKI